MAAAPADLFHPRFCTPIVAIAGLTMGDEMGQGAPQIPADPSRTRSAENGSKLRSTQPTRAHSPFS
jgi:hypothetical protein